VPLRLVRLAGLSWNILVSLTCLHRCIWWRVFSFRLFPLLLMFSCDILYWDNTCIFHTLICSTCTQIQSLLNSNPSLCWANETTAWDNLFWGCLFLLLACTSRISSSTKACVLSGQSVTQYIELEIPTSSASVLFPSWRGQSSCATEGLVFPCFRWGVFCQWCLCGQVCVPLALFSAEIPKCFSEESLLCAPLRTDDWQRFPYS